MGSNGTYSIQFGMGETLTRVSSTGEPVGWLAEKVEPIDATHWRIRLRDGVTFWNGRPLDAAAVQRSLMRSVTKNPAAASAIGLAKVEVADPKTAVLELKAPNGGVPAVLPSFLLVIHDAEEAEKVGDAAFDAKPVMTGPFIPAEFKPNELTVVRRNDKYWGGMPGVERAEFRNVADGNARLAAVLAGDVDVARNMAPQSLGQARTAGLQVASVQGANTYHVYLNGRRPPFDDPTVRRAMSLAIDRKALVDKILQGGTIATGVYPSFYPFGKGEPLPTDPAKAKALLGGKSYEIELLTYPQRPELGLMATAIQAMLKETGINAQIKSVENITPIVEKGDYGATMYSVQTAPTGDPSYMPSILYHSQGAWNGQVGYQSARFDAAAERLTAETDPARRIEAARAASALLNEDAPAIFLASPMYHNLLSARVKGFEPHPLEAYFLTHATAIA
jgi:peptide/nickel transport system substrate-binding protein